MPKERRMKIAICASMIFAEKMLEVKRQLEKIGHIAFISQFAEGYLGKAEKEKEELAVHDKNEHDAIRKFWEIIKKSDAILVLNYDRKGIRNYIGGNTLMEIGFAHVLNKPIFLMNPIPDIEYYRSEIEAVSPVILEQNLNLIM
jgi:nucleoside 2-deoxyribosyltransferase